MSRIGMFAPSIIALMAFAAKAWAPPEYYWHSYPTSPGAKPTNAAMLKRQAKKRRNRK